MARRPPYVRLEGSGEKGIDMAHEAEPGADPAPRTKLITVAELELMKERRDDLLAALKWALPLLVSYYSPNGATEAQRRHFAERLVAAQAAIEAAS